MDNIELTGTDKKDTSIVNNDSTKALRSIELFTEELKQNIMKNKKE